MTTETQTTAGSISPETISEMCQHYFLRTEDGTPYGCVAIAPMALTGEEAGRICRGIALCSDEDRFDKTAAKRKAIARVKRALGTQQSGEPIKTEDRVVVDLFYDCSELAVELEDTVNKVNYNVEPTPRESGILYHLVNRLGGEPVEPRKS